MKQSIVIPYHKDKDMLSFCLKRLKATIPSNVDIIIVGNNADKVEIDLRFDDDRICYHRIQKNLQYPKALNFAFDHCTSDIITVLDPDAFVWDGWYEPMLSLIESDPTIGVVGANLVNPRTDRILDFGIMYSRFNSAHTLMGAAYNHPLASGNRKVQAICSAVFMTRRGLFNEVGGMDEEIPYSYTDCDYCLKIAEKGYETWGCGESIAYHKGSTDPHNSKSSFHYYHGDAKGIFGLKDYPRLHDDMEFWFNLSAMHAKQTAPISQDFVLVDLSSMFNKPYYYDIISRTLGAEFLDTIVVGPPSRDSDNLALYGTLPYAYLDLATPILYFVDSFLSLFDNRLWFRMRNIERDFVVDRHANMVSLASIANRLV